MLVKNWMSKNVITIDADDSMNTAIRLMKRHKIKVLPVMEKGNLVGILSDRDIKKASASEATSLDVYELAYILDKVKIRNIMSKPVITVPPLLTVDEVAEILVAKDISSVPVVDEKERIIGILTKTDILKVLISLTGMHRRGIDIGIEVADQPGSIMKITETIQQFGGRVSSILISYDEATAGHRNAFIRVYQINQNQLLRLKAQLKETHKILYFLDFLNDQREAI